MDYSLSVSIMAVVSRRRNVEEISQRLDYPVSVHYDTMRQGNWYNGSQAWSNFDRNCTHHLNLEDDVKLCNNFIPGVLAVIEANPKAIISLCTWKSNAAKFDKAMKLDTHWFIRQCSLSGQAVIMPTEWILKMLLMMGEYSDEKKDFDKFISTWAYASNHPIWCTVPSLVEHSEETSVIGHNFSGRIAGEYFIGEIDPTSIDWKHNMDIAPYYKEPPWDDAAKKWKGKIRYE